MSGFPNGSYGAETQPGLDGLDRPTGPSLNWWFDIDEYDEDMNFLRTVSIPLNFVVNETLSVQEFLSIVQNTFDAHALPIISGRRQYMITAIAGQPASTNAAVRFKNRDTTIQYRIWNEDELPFQLRFMTGPHGSVPGGAPDNARVDMQSGYWPEIMQTPYYATQAVVMDRPPVSPQVNIVPFKNINNRVLIMLNSSTGEVAEKPFPIEDSDLEDIRLQFLAQGLLPNNTVATNEQIIQMALDSDLTFRSDDPSYRYEIYRTREAPMSYQDFKGKRRADIIEHLGTVGGNRYATYATYLEDLVPNTKYYYCFRVIDVHGHVSNPTVPYEVEMVDNSGQVYLLYKEYYFPAEQNQNFSKNGRQYLYIAPTWTQSRFDDANTSIETVGIDEVPPPNVLGTSETDSVWNKVFKVRLTSKKTGKKIDLNLTFKNTGVVNP